MKVSRFFFSKKSSTKELLFEKRCKNFYSLRVNIRPRIQDKGSTMAIGFIRRWQRQRQRRRKPAQPPAPVAVPRDPSRCALLVVAHPALHRSRANAALLDAARARREITLHDLYETYADFLIDVEAEQQRLLDHHLIILQFPMYWYSTPALLKEWLDMVWLHGFAYGREGTRLRGKTLLVAVTAGGEAQAYHPEGVNRFSMTEFLRPLEQTAHLCGLTWAEPFIVHDSIQMDDDGRRAAAAAYADRLAAAITMVRRP
jgi:glutathione-regulated potassium-efflux system ancillary protein KefG